MRKEHQKSIRTMVMVPLSLTFLILIAIFLYTGYYIREQGMHHAINHRYQGVSTLFQELEKQRIDLMTAVLQYAGQQEDLHKAMLQGDRERLLRIAQPFFSQLKTQHGVTHFYFHGIDSRTFLRLHQPERFGDVVERKTFVTAQQTKNPSAGFELGPLGTYTLRAVVPWYSTSNQLLGYLELGQELDQVLANLKRVTGTEFLIMVDKAYLQRDAWEEGMRMLKREPDWGQFTSQVLINRTTNSFPPNERYLFPSKGNDPHHYNFSDNGKYFQVKAFPLLDAKQRAIGNFVMMVDITEERNRFIMFMLRIGLFTLVLCGALFGFAYRTLGRMDRTLVQVRQDLVGEVEKAEQLNSRLMIEVAERKRAEEDLKSLNQTLERRILDRTRKLESLNSELEGQRRELERAYEDLKVNQSTILHQDKMASIGQLAAGVAHDINNPIGFVTNNLGELEQYLKDISQFIGFQAEIIEKLRPDDKVLELVAAKRKELHIDEAVDDLDDIIQESLEGTRRVQGIVQNLRKFSRIDEDEYELVDIHECLDSTVTISSNELRYKADVIRHYGNLPKIYCYPGQLNQVFMNLLINAAHAMDDYGQIEIATWQQSGSVFIRFVDTGSGISEEVQGRIFEPFFTTKDVGTGTGLGLSIAYDIIQKHAGDIWVDSEPGQGTSFTIRLPARERLEP